MSTPHLAMNFPSMTRDIVIVHVDQKIARECYVASLKVEPTKRLYRTSPRRRFRERVGRSTERHSRDRRTIEHMVALVDLDPRLDEARIEPSKDLRPLPLWEDDHKTYIGTSLKPDDSKLISQTLIDNTDLFTWTTAHIPGVSSDIITHSLSIYKEAIPVA